MRPVTVTHSEGMTEVEIPNAINCDEKDFVGFYPENGFWIENRIDILDEENSRRLAGIIPEMVFKVDSERFSAVVCIDGLMLLRMNHLATTMPNMSDPTQFEASVRWWDEHVDYANAMQLCLELESIKCAQSGKIRASDVIIANTCRVGFSGGLPIRKVLSNGRSLMSARAATANWINFGRAGPPPMEAISLGWSSWIVVSERSIGNALSQFEKACADKTLIKYLSFIVKAKTAHSRNDFSGGIYTPMVRNRICGEELWTNLNPAMKYKSDKDRRYPTISNIFHELKSAGKISETLFLQLNLCKRARNKLMHESQSAICLPSDCISAANAATGLALREFSPSIEMPWSCSVEF